jgi:hypothetical protein
MEMMRNSPAKGHHSQKSTKSPQKRKSFATSGEYVLHNEGKSLPGGSTFSMSSRSNTQEEKNAYRQHSGFRIGRDRARGAYAAI